MLNSQAYILFVSAKNLQYYTEVALILKNKFVLNINIKRSVNNFKNVQQKLKNNKFIITKKMFIITNFEIANYAN